MDSLSSHYEFSESGNKLQYFRIKELKDVLTQLGLAKQGKKQVKLPTQDFDVFCLPCSFGQLFQDLVDRILALLSDSQGSKNAWKKPSLGKDGILKIIDDTYRKMQVHGATDLASKVYSNSSSNVIKPKVEEDVPQFDVKVACLCGSSAMLDTVIQCEDKKCSAWQHLNCVVIPDKAIEGTQPPHPPQFYCEICRLNRADPFCVTMGHPLRPVKWANSNVTTDGANPAYNVEKTFQLTRADRDFLQKAGDDLQVWCILLNDKVPFRMQWPQFVELQVNGVPIRTVTRPGSQLLGINGRDDGPVITSCSREGSNKISLSACDSRIFCFGIRLVRRRSVSQVLNLVPKESDGEKFDDALARIIRCVGGGAEKAGDSDSDLEVVADTVTVNLRCPMSGSRIKVAGRFKACIHMGCFDLGTFIELNQRSRKWQCPICLKNYTLENIIIDPYFNRITTAMVNCGEDVTEIEVKPDGSWRVKNESDSKDLVCWHRPDGSLCLTANGDVKYPEEMLKQIKQEAGSEGRPGLRIGIKKNHDGVWEVSKPDEFCVSANYVSDEIGNINQKLLHMSSSATGSNRDGEDASVNQDGGRFDFTNNHNELDSLSLNCDPPIFGLGNRLSNSAPAGTDLIVLSDSDEDNMDTFNVMPSAVNNIFPETGYATGQVEGMDIHFTVPGITETYPDVQALGVNSNPLDLFHNGGDEFGMPLWETLPSCTQNGGFRLFGTDTDVAVPLVDVQETVINATSANGYHTLTSDVGMGVAGVGSQAPSVCPLNNGIRDDLDDNPLAFGVDDPSLQLFLPSGPLETTAQPECRNNTDMSNVHAENWISLSLGGGIHNDQEPLVDVHSREHLQVQESGMDTLANTAMFLRMNEEDPNPTATQRSESPFSLHQQQRSVRRRLYLSIDSDSE